MHWYIWMQDRTCWSFALRPSEATVGLARMPWRTSSVCRLKQQSEISSDQELRHQNRSSSAQSYRFSQSNSTINCWFCWFLGPEGCQNSFLCWGNPETMGSFGKATIEPTESICWCCSNFIDGIIWMDEWIIRISWHLEHGPAISLLHVLFLIFKWFGT